MNSKLHFSHFNTHKHFRLMLEPSCALQNAFCMCFCFTATVSEVYRWKDSNTRFFGALCQLPETPPHQVGPDEEPAGDNPKWNKNSTKAQWGSLFVSGPSWAGQFDHSCCLTSIPTGAWRPHKHCPLYPAFAVLLWWGWAPSNGSAPPRPQTHPSSATERAAEEAPTSTALKSWIFNQI